MKRVIIIHGFHGSPNGNWKPWLLAELENLDVYASSIALPNPNNPAPEEWVREITRQVEMNKEDEVYLVGHSLGVTAILRYLESPNSIDILGAVLVSGPCEKTPNKDVDNFLDKPFSFERIKSKAKSFLIIHSDNDPYVPLSQARTLSKELNGKLVIIPNGGHFNRASGHFTLPECLDGLKEMMGNQSD